EVEFGAALRRLPDALPTWRGELEAPRLETIARERLEGAVRAALSRVLRRSGKLAEAEAQRQRALALADGPPEALAHGIPLIPPEWVVAVGRAGSRGAEDPGSGAAHDRP